MNTLTMSPSVATTVAAQQARESVETSRLARAAQLAREGRGDPARSSSYVVPRRRSRLIWLLGLRSHNAI